MANYTTNLEIATRFTPYRQQLPVDEMIGVANQKQAMYNEGIQKIQDSIDKVAGLPVVREVDKQYLQSKLNSLGTKLKTFVGADYSNFQLTNNVMGMTKEIADDPNVVNAVSSTQKYREQVKRMQDDISNGKANPANNFRFNKRANDWLSSTDINQSFNAYYQPPIDVWAKIKDIAKDVGIDEQDVQQMYQTDERGEILRDKKTGEPIWNPIMAEKILKGKDAGKVLQAFQSALTPADYEQLAINGEYEKAGYTPEMLKAELRNATSQQSSFINDKIKDLNFALYQENQKNNKDVEKIQSLQTQLDYFRQSQQNLDNSLAKSISLVDTNPDAVRASLYTNNYLTNMSKTLSSQETSTKYSINPKFTVTMELNRFNREVQRDKIADAHWAAEMNLKERGLSLDERKLKLEEDKLKPSMDSSGLLPGGIAVDDYALQAKDNYEQQYSRNIETLNGINYRIGLEFYKKTNSQNPGESKDAYETRIKQLIAKDAGGDITSSPDKVNEYIARIASKQLSDWAVNKNNVPAEMRGLIESQYNLTQTLSEQKANIEDIKNKALQSLQEEGINVSSDKELLGKISPITLNFPDKSLNLTKEDILNFVRINPNRFNKLGAASVDSKQRQEAVKAEEILRRKYPNDFERIEQKLYRTYEATPGGSELSLISDIFPSVEPYVSALSKKIGINVSLSLHPEFKKYAELLTGQDYKSLQKRESELFMQRGIVSQPTSLPVQRGKEPKEDVISRLASVIGTSDKNEMPDYNKEDMLKVLNDKDYISSYVTTIPSINGEAPKYALTINTSAGQKSMYITNQGYKLITGETPPTVNIPSLGVSKLLRKGTTNDTESGDPQGAFYSNNKFSSYDSKETTITGDMVADIANPDIAWMKLYIHDKKTGEVIDTITFPDPSGNQRLYTKNADGSYNNQLDSYPSVITEAVVKQLRNR